MLTLFLAFYQPRAVSDSFILLGFLCPPKNFYKQNFFDGDGDEDLSSLIIILQTQRNLSYIVYPVMIITPMMMNKNSDEHDFMR